MTYADADSIEPSELVVTFDVLSSYPEGRGATGKVFYSADVIEVDCDDNQFRVVRITQLDEAHEVVGEMNGFDAEWVTIGAGTAAENFRRFACDEALRDSPVTDPFASAALHWAD